MRALNILSSGEGTQHIEYIVMRALNILSSGEVWNAKCAKIEPYIISSPAAIYRFRCVLWNVCERFYKRFSERS